MSLPRVCYLGAYDPTYPRNLILRRGLALQGVQVVECNAARKLDTVGRARTLLRQFHTVADQCDVIILGEFGQMLTPLAWWLARRYHKRLVTDAIVPLYDTAVYDRRRSQPYSWTALRYRLFDRLTVTWADAVLVETGAERDYYVRNFKVPAEKFTVLPVGASREWFELIPHEGPDVLITFHGSYIPFHGIDVILRAAQHLRERRDMRFELMGAGQTLADMRSLALELGLSNVIFRGHVSVDELFATVSRATIGLGIFGTNPKAARAVTNKVYQTLAAGKPLITADTPAIREIFTPGEHLIGIPPGDPQALAAAIISLADDPSLRRRLGEAGRARMRAEFTEEALGRRLLEVLV